MIAVLGEMSADGAFPELGPSREIAGEEQWRHFGVRLGDSVAFGDNPLFVVHSEILLTLGSSCNDALHLR